MTERRNGKCKAQNLDKNVDNIRVRKRILITVLVVEVLTIGLYVSTVPRPGTVEWHQAKFTGAVKRIRGDTFADRVRRIYYRCRNIPPPAPAAGAKFLADVDMLISNRAALIRFGVLAETNVYLTNIVARDVYKALKLNRYADDITNGMVSVSGDRDIIFITAPPAVLSEIETVVRRADGAK